MRRKPKYRLLPLSKKLLKFLEEEGSELSFTAIERYQKLSDKLQKEARQLEYDAYRTNALRIAEEMHEVARTLSWCTSHILNRLLVLATAKVSHRSDIPVEGVSS